MTTPTIQITTCTDAMYNIAKFSNDENYYKLFVYNNDSNSDKYGCFFLMTANDGFVTQKTDNDLDLSNMHLSEAIDHVCDDAVSEDLIREAVKSKYAELLTIAKAVEAFKKEFDQDATQVFSNGEHSLNVYNCDNPISDEVHVANYDLKSNSISSETLISWDDYDCILVNHTALYDIDRHDPLVSTKNATYYIMNGSNTAMIVSGFINCELLADCQLFNSALELKQAVADQDGVDVEDIEQTYTVTFDCHVWTIKGFDHPKGFELQTHTDKSIEQFLSEWSL